MKKLTLLTILIFLNIVNFAQITLEHTYDSAGYYYSSAMYQELYMVNLEVDGQKYVFIDRVNKNIKFYNTNHSIWKSIPFNTATDLNASANVMATMYISQHLFDNDDGVEFLYCDQNNTNAVTQIIDDNGSILFTANNQAPLIRGHAPQESLPIYNTLSGTKLILSGTKDSSAYVYSLPGSLTTGLVDNSSKFNNLKMSNPYPNPTIDIARIDYQLPKDIKSGEIIVYDIQGKMVKSFKVDNTFDFLIISTEDLSSGIYFYNLQTTDGISDGKKLVTLK